ncbi:23S rRNA (adenine(2030)-N(6))-methyltransferase RlmJ [Marinobacter salarius]|uniref:23S rRNA (adenine(2030)-N(6))-methyltransferase RlmJ n=1 Tax=Marinobacter salarius TaxID=1420917 RepID=UPI003D9C55CB
MLSYLHAFHAGNFADVHKHAALTLAVRMMQAKSSAIACFDTHAGSASYDLAGDRALKTGEAAAGIQKVWPLRAELHSDDWQAVLAGLASGEGKDGQLASYPGSPRWFLRYLREQDTLTAFELHPAEGETLGQWAAGHSRVKVFQEDGLKGLLRHLPPRQPRLLVLTDPSYEIKSDYEEVANTLARAWQKCRHGVYLIWYPILAGFPHKRLKDAVSEGPVRKVLCSEVALNRAPQRGMSGSGVLVVNPPWGFDTRLAEMMDTVSGDRCLGLSSNSSWLVPE